MGKITITNEKGRLSKEDIEKMVKEAEQFREQDEAQRKKIEARNELERYAYNVRSSLDREDLKEKFTEDDRTKVREAIEETLKWLEEHAEADADEYGNKQKDLESVVNPIMIRIYNDQAGGSDGTSESGGAENAGGN